MRILRAFGGLAFAGWLIYVFLAPSVPPPVGKTFIVQPAAPGPADAAFKLCAKIDATGLGSAPCEVSGWNQSVTATLDMNSGEARDLCGKLAKVMPMSGWTLHIKSPYSGDASIAYCNL